MKYYSGNNKPYIYVSFAKECEEKVLPKLELLSSEEVLFWRGEKIDKREMKRIEGACAVILFVTQKFFDNVDFRKIVDEAVKQNKNILTIYLEDISMDSWGHMQLDSAQAMFLKNFSSEEDFNTRLKESAIFRDMKVTPQQKRFKRNTSLVAVFIPIAAAILIFAAVVYPLLIVPAQQLSSEMETFGLKGLTQQELDSITDINIIGTNVFTNVDDVGISQTMPDGTIAYEVKYKDKDPESGVTQRGNISDLSCLKKLKHLSVIRICGNNITDLSPLRDCPRLERIVVENNPIRSLEGLEDLKYLWELSVNYTDINDLSPIQNLPNLDILCFKFTPVSEIPDTDTIRGLNVIYAEGTYITSMPYLGVHDDMDTIDVHRTYGNDRIKDYSFLKDIHRIGRLSMDSAQVNELRPYLEGTILDEIDSSGMNITTLEDLSWLTVKGRLDVCHAESLISLEGIEHFEGIETLVLKGCNNITDLTPCLKLKSLKYLEVYENQRYLVESQLNGAPFEIWYMDD